MTTATLPQTTFYVAVKRAYARRLQADANECAEYGAEWAMWDAPEIRVFRGAFWQLKWWLDDGWRIKRTYRNGRRDLSLSTLRAEFARCDD